MKSSPLSSQKYKKDHNDEHKDEGGEEIISLDESSVTEEELKKLTVVKLKELAKERKISIPGKSRKDEIIAIILKGNPAAEPSKDTTPEKVVQCTTTCVTAVKK